MISETKSKSKIIYEVERTGDIKHSLASIQETMELLKFETVFDLHQGLKEIIDYFVRRMKM